MMIDGVFVDDGGLRKEETPHLKQLMRAERQVFG